VSTAYYTTINTCHSNGSITLFSSIFPSPSTKGKGIRLLSSIPATRSKPNGHPGTVGLILRKIATGNIGLLRHAKALVPAYGGLIKTIYLTRWTACSSVLVYRMALPTYRTEGFAAAKTLATAIHDSIGL